MTRLFRATANALRYIRVLGLRRGLATYFRFRLGTKSEAIEAMPPGSNVNVAIRRRTVDVGIWDEVLVTQDYDFGPLSHRPALIVDAGANIGLTSIYFAIRYPGVRIIALEPEPENYAILLRNVSQFPQIETLQAALWSEKGKVCFRNADGMSVSGQCYTPVPGDDLVDAVSIDSLLHERGWTAIDILKMDIEGAEKRIFEHSRNWINLVRHFALEFHDRKIPGCEAAFWQATSGRRFTLIRRGANHLFIDPGSSSGPS